MNDLDHRFFRAIAVGAVWGALALWAALTAVFFVLTDQTLATTAGFSLLPGVFCGPFLGGLFTTAAVGEAAPQEATVASLPATAHHRAA